MKGSGVLQMLQEEPQSGDTHGQTVGEFKPVLTLGGLDGGVDGMNEDDDQGDLEQKDRHGFHLLPKKKLFSINNGYEALIPVPCQKTNDA